MPIPEFGTEDDFHRFVRELGPDANRYTSSELRWLCVEVHRMAELLIEIFRTEQRKIAEAATHGVRIIPFFTKGSQPASPPAQRPDGM